MWIVTLVVYENLCYLAILWMVKSCKNFKAVTIRIDSQGRDILAFDLIHMEVKLLSTEVWYACINELFLNVCMVSRGLAFGAPGFGPRSDALGTRYPTGLPTNGWS
jgi:hypothetical protein